MRNQGARNAYHRLLGGFLSLRGAGWLLLPSQPSGRYRDSSALKVRERGPRGCPKVGGPVMRTTAPFAATSRLPDWQSGLTVNRQPLPPVAGPRVPSDLNPANKWFRSLLWERTVLFVLAKVERLPPNVQSEIADRVGKYINFARTSRDDATLTRFIEGAAGERAKVAQEAKSTANPLWTAPALAEAWCVSRLSLSNGNLNSYSTMCVINAIEDFASHREQQSPSTPWSPPIGRIHQQIASLGSSRLPKPHQ